MDLLIKTTNLPTDIVKLIEDYWNYHPPTNKKNKHFRKLSGIHRINLYGCEKVNDYTLSLHLKNVEYLDISFCKKVTLDGIKSLKKLKQINITGTNIKREELMKFNPKLIGIKEPICRSDYFEYFNFYAKYMMSKKDWGNNDSILFKFTPIYTEYGEFDHVEIWNPHLNN